MPDAKGLILQLFARELRERPDSDCARFADGCRPEVVPLVDGELVYGIYKGTYFFTPVSLIVRRADGFERIRWGDVVHCSSVHGEGQAVSELRLADGRVVSVTVGEMATGWVGRISQLYHRMIELYGRSASQGSGSVAWDAFLADADDAYCIAPNVMPHPPLDFYRGLFSTWTADGRTRILLQIADEDTEPAATAAIVVTDRPRDDVEGLAAILQTDGAIEADDATIAQAGGIPTGLRAWLLIWD
ncbi:MAG: hypothetical protein H6817_03705 [Phycisphaerales bacterium]|nr:hypothetical protein [Phycisphaerales bacterium]